jgi:methyl-accepting chemotaxis protein
MGLSHMSLRAKLVVAIALLLGMVSLFLWIYFPWRMDTLARRWLERRATAMALVLTTASAPGIEFDDPNSVRDLLSGLASAPEVSFAVVRRANGTRLAGFRDDKAPELRGEVKRPIISYDGGQLRVDAPIKTRSDVAGTLSLGFSLDELRAEKSAQDAMVAWVSFIVFLIGLGVSLFVGTLLVRPVRVMTDVALRIARGDLSQAELRVRGRDEVGQMALAFNRMLSSLRELAKSAERIGAGDLTVEVDMEGQVAEAFNKMVAEQRALVRRIADTATQLGSAAAEIYASAQHQESASTQQAEGVEEVSRTVQSLLESASHIADSARGVLSNAEQTKKTTEVTSERVAGLGNHANRIAEILEVIRDIADRSDLLALNASLEATRAGEAGRAFSLVAAEMRRLAERVTASVTNVKSLLVDIRAFGTSTVMTTDEGRQLAEGTTESARQITMVTQQQRTATEQVLQSTRQISGILSQTVASAQQTRSASEVLKSLAEELTDSLARFRVEAVAPAPAPPVRFARSA